MDATEIVDKVFQDHKVDLRIDTLVLGKETPPTPNDIKLENEKYFNILTHFNNIEVALTAMQKRLDQMGMTINNSDVLLNNLNDDMADVREALKKHDSK